MSTDGSRVYFKLRMKDVFKGTARDYESLNVRIYRNGANYASVYTDTAPSWGRATTFFYASDQKTHVLQKSTVNLSENYIVVSVAVSMLKGTGKFTADADTDYIRKPKGSDVPPGGWDVGTDDTSKTGALRLR